MREHSVPCCICRRPTFHDDAVCGRGACVELMAHSQRLINNRLAVRATRTAGSDEGSGTRLLGPSPFSTGPAVSPDGSVESSGSGSTRVLTPDERPSVAPLPSR